jgi:hypothetical protein
MPHFTQELTMPTTVDFHLIRRRVASVLLIAAALALASPVAWARDAPPTPPPAGPVEPYADLLVTTASSDMQLPWQSLPPVLGVLDLHAHQRIDALNALSDAQRQAAAAAYAGAVRAASRRGPAATAAVQRAANRCQGDFACFKQCTLQIESHGNYGAVSPGGKYRGAWQFDQPTWNGAVSRAGHPEYAGQDPTSAPPAVQDAAAHQLYQERGNQPWEGRC